MAQQKKKKAAEKTVVEEKALLDDLFDKVDMEVPAGPEMDTAGGRMSHALSELIHSVVASGEKIERVDKTLLDGMITELDQKISGQVDEVLHHEDFQKVESAWKGLKFLVDRTDFRRNTKLEILNVSKEDLMNDFEDVPEPYQSGLFKHMYKDEYDTPGGEPIGAIIANYEFSNNSQDIALLNNASKIAASCHAPFLGSVGQNFLGLRSIDELTTIPDVAPIFETPEFTKWNAFRDTEDSRYVGLTLPRFLLRLPYGEDTTPAKTFNYNEKVTGEEHNKYLWGNGSFAMASCLTQSFAEHGHQNPDRGADVRAARVRARGTGFHALVVLQEQGLCLLLLRQLVSEAKAVHRPRLHRQLTVVGTPPVSLPGESPFSLFEGHPEREHWRCQGKGRPAARTRRVAQPIRDGRQEPVG